MTKKISDRKTLDDKYSYQIDGDDTVHLFRNEEERCDLLTNPLIAAIFRIEELEARNEKMKCCSNCDNWNWKHNKCEKKLKGDCFKHNKWVMRNF